MRGVINGSSFMVDVQSWGLEEEAVMVLELRIPEWLHSGRGR